MGLLGAARPGRGAAAGSACAGAAVAATVRAGRVWAVFAGGFGVRRTVWTGARRTGKGLRMTGCNR